MQYLIPCALFLLLAGCTGNEIKVAKKANITSAISKDTTLKMLTYGLPDMRRHRDMNAVAKKYGFKFVHVAGCVVPKTLLDSIHTENDKINLILQSKFGKKWEDGFWAEVDTMQSLQMEVEKIVKQEKYIITKEKELDKDGYGLYYDIDPATEKNTFLVDAYSWLADTNRITFYKMSVNYKRRSVTLLSAAP